VSSFGAQLKEEREKQGVSLEDISLSTKIGTRMLRALEEEHFDQLPGGIFNKGFIRAYARCLGMDEEQAIADYLAATGASPAAKKPENNDPAPDLSPILEPPPREPGKPAAGLPWGTLAIALLIVALGFAGWGFYSRKSEKATQDSAPPAVNSPSAQPPTVAEQPPPEAKPTKPASATTSKPDELKVATPTATPSASSASVGAPTSTPASDQSQPINPSNRTFQVVIKARTDYSWLSISVDGEIVTRAILIAPSEKSVRAENQIVVRAGNVGALDFEFNGTKLPNQGDYGVAKTLTFDAHGLRSPAPKAETPPTVVPSPEKP
jgi:cytoskeleton protein RodZ